MPTLQEILDNDLGLGSEKVAATRTTETDETTKLAMSLGLIEENDETETSQDNNGLNKEAQMSLDKVYSELFPADADIVGEEKLASVYETETEVEDGLELEMEKEAAASEGAIGERAFEYFAQYVDAHITKIAEEIVGKLEDNEDDSGDAMDTDGDEGAEGEAAMSASHPAASGHFEMKSSPSGEIKQAAINKHLLKMFLGQ